MSRIFGFFNRDGQPSSRYVLTTMQDQIPPHDIDTSNIYTEKTIGFGHAMVWNTLESHHEYLPALKQIGGKRFIITGDIRLDNRAELLHRLSLDPLTSRTESDLILEAYLKWGENTPEHLLGDFAFIIYDFSKNLLFCATDHSAIKPLYYYLDNKRFVFSDDMRAIAAHPDVPKDYNDEAVAYFLSQSTFAHPTFTLFNAIKKLPPATTFSITAKDIKKRVYWNVHDSPDIRLKNIDDYAEMLRELLDKSVTDRTRTEYPIASHQSGGLDSSSIAVLAQRQLSRQNKSLYSYNWVHPPEHGDDLTHYEWANSRIVGESENMHNRYLPIDKASLASILWSDDLANNELTTTMYEKTLLKEAQKDGVRTVLSGWGGDELISYNARVHYQELMRRAQILRAIGHIYHQSKTVKNFIGGIYYKLLKPILPSYQETTFGQHWHFATESFAADYQRISNQKIDYPTHTTRQNQVWLYTHGHLNTRINSWAALGVRHRIEYRYPLLDKRIIEFALGIPPELYLHKGITRYLFRYSLAGILPEPVRWCNTKFEPNRVAKLKTHTCDIVSDWTSLAEYALAENHYIDVPKLLRAQLSALDQKSINALIKSVQIVRMGHSFKKISVL